MEGIVLALFVCLLLVLITKYLSVPAIPFYILAGVLLGSAGLGLVTSDEISRFLSAIQAERGCTPTASTPAPRNARTIWSFSFLTAICVIKIPSRFSGETPELTW